ncbi:MAG: hypothetical protein A2138_11745 [Deltaproteobacteria bacterium RBG_16_71_12]|nr:MAG: hypothetical protein A2138_11745 [Deltaproteobacteria bacterium RBG_16_71_12]
MATSSSAPKRDNRLISPTTAIGPLSAGGRLGAGEPSSAAKGSLPQTTMQSASVSASSTMAVGDRASPKVTVQEPTPSIMMVSAPCVWPNERARCLITSGRSSSKNCTTCRAAVPMAPPKRAPEPSAVSAADA